MGYSCTQDAQDTLAVIGKVYATDGNPNILTIRGNRYFFERGQEQVDGAITGKLMAMVSDDYCVPCGNVKIAADGSLVRFPRLRSVDKVEIENTARDMRARNPQLLRSWAYGIL